MTSPKYTFTPEGGLGTIKSKKYTFTPEGQSGKPQQPQEEEESFGKSTLRTLAQPVQGYLATTPPGIAAGLWQAFGLGDALDEDEIEQIRKISEREGIPFDEEAYRQSAEEAQSMIPTVSNIAREVEEQTGGLIPLEPKTRGQKALRFFTEATRLAPGKGSHLKSQQYPGTFRGMETTLPRPVLGAGVEATKEVLQEAGVPEPLAELVSFGVLKQSPKGSPELSIGPKEKPSGLKERNFELVTKPHEVSQGKLDKISRKLETDFRDISGKIIEESPIGETAKNLASDPGFKQESRELLNQAQEIADTIPGTIPAENIKKAIADKAAKQSKGFAESEYDKSYKKFVTQSLKDIKGKDISHGQLVEQYRKNNSALSEYFEPGASKALNRAKKDALLDQNRAIADILEKSNPELSKVFKEGNERWTKIMDAEAVDEFVNNMFGEKVNYKDMHDFFDKNGYDRIFKRALGDKGYKDFEVLMKDMLSSEAPYKMLKVAKSRGLDDVAKTAAGYVIHPKLGVAKATWDISKASFKSAVNLLLDKPKLAITWKKGIDDLKKGNFAQAEKSFNTLKTESETKRVETLKKFKEKKSENTLKHADENVVAAKKENLPKEHNKIEELNTKLDEASRKVRELDLEALKLPDRASGKFDPIVEYDVYDRLTKAATEEMKILTEINKHKKS